MMAESRRRLLQLLTEQAYEKREVTLASGKKSSFYIDCKQVSLSAEGHLLIGRLFYRAILDHERAVGSSIAGVGGLTMGADPLASAVSLTSALAARPIPAFLVRKEPKGHGTSAWIEGAKNLTPGAELAIVEDVVTTGGSASKALARVREAGFRAELVVALVDRLEGGREALEAEGVKLVSLYTRTDFPA